jgi:hypothetical protein
VRFAQAADAALKREVTAQEEVAAEQPAAPAPPPAISFRHETPDDGFVGSGDAVQAA